jgi:hypothetical protein
MAKTNRMKKAALTFGEMVMPNCPMTTAASRVAVTFSTLNPATFRDPIEKPMASDRKIVSSGVGP